MGEEETGGLRGLRAWAEDASRRTAQLLPQTGRVLRDAADYDDAIDELGRLEALLEHDPALRNTVGIRLGALFVLRYAAGNRPEDRQRAEQLLREGRTPKPGVDIPAEDIEMASLFLSWLPLPQLGAMMRGELSFTDASLMSVEPGAAEAVEAAMREFAASTRADGSPEGAQIRRVIAGIDAFRATGEPDGLLDVIPEGHPFAAQLRQMVGMLQDVPQATRTEFVRQAPTLDVQSPDALAMQGLVPALMLMTDGVTRHDADQLRAAGVALRKAHAQMSPDHPMAGRVADTVDALRHLGEGTDGNLADLDTARRDLPESFRTLVETLTAGNDSVRLPLRVFDLKHALSKAQRDGDREAAHRAIAELEGLVEGLTPHDPPYFLVHLALADGHIDDGRLHEDREAMLRGVGHVDLVVAAGEHAPSPVRATLRAREEQARTVRAVLTRDPAPMADLPTAGPDAAPGELCRSAQALHIRHLLTRDPLDLDQAIELGTRARRIFAEGRAQSLAAGGLWDLSGYHRTRWDATRGIRDMAAATETALESLRALAADVVLQLGAEQGLLAARSGASRAVEAALWAATHGQVDEAVTALELGRALVLRAASVSAGVPELLEAAGHPGLAAAWREQLRRSGGGPAAPASVASAAAPAPASDAASSFADELPSALRRQALEALGYRRGGGAGSQGHDRHLDPDQGRRRDQGMLRDQGPDQGRDEGRGWALGEVPGVRELSAAVEACDADALVYLMSGRGSDPGVAVVVGPDGGTRAVGLPLLCEDRSGPLVRYLTAAAARSRHLEGLSEGGPLAEESGPVDGAAVERAWEQALSGLCDWAYPAAMGPVLDALAAPNAAAARPDVRPASRVPRLVLVPCGNLGVVPWHAARLPGTEPAEYACRLVAVSYAASGGQFARAAVRDRRPPTGAPVLLADPRVDLTHAERETAALGAAFYPQARMLGEYFEPSVTPEAPGTPDELLGVLAQPVSVLHLACHGSAGLSPTVSALHLAFPDGAEDLPAGEGGPGARPDLGMLTVSRLLDRASGAVPAPGDGSGSPDADGYGRPDGDGRPGGDGPLVVLSACETDLSRGDHDEALTLATAFVAGGARDVVGSRWTTQDGASALMMSVFHHHLVAEGRSPADALRAAQLWMLDPDRRDPGTLDAELQREMDRPGLDRLPVWAAFIHQGNPGPAAARQPRPGGSGPSGQSARAPEDPLLRLVGDHLDDVRAVLDEGQFALVRTRLEALAAGPGEPRDVRRAVQGVRLALLALPPGHPVRLALDGTRRSGAAAGPAAAVAAVAGARAVLARITEGPDA